MQVAADLRCASSITFSVKSCPRAGLTTLSSVAPQPTKPSAFEQVKIATSASVQDCSVFVDVLTKLQGTLSVVSTSEMVRLVFTLVAVAFHE